MIIMERSAYYFLTFVIFLLFPMITASAAAQGEQPATVVIEGGTLIDGNGGTPVQDAVIVIRGNKFEAVSRKGQASYPAGAQVISAAGKFVLPGLTDMHVHWEHWMPELFLAHGVTSAVDLAARDWQLNQKKAIAEGRMTGPRLFLTTPPLTGRLLWDMSFTRPLESAQMARKLIQDAGPGRENYAVAKAYTELTAEQLQAIAEESHKAGRNVIAHLGSLDARQAAELGVDAIAHASGVALATISDPVKAGELQAFVRLGISVDFPLYLMYHAFMDPSKVDALIALLVQKRVRIEPDLINTARWGAKRRAEFLAEDTKLLQDPNLQYVPADVREKILSYRPFEQLDSQQRAQLQRGYENLQSFLRKFVQAGGTMLAGCDAASFVLPGICLHRELELLVEAGLTPMQAIQAATKNNAEFLQERDMGTVEPGKLADLIVLREDPLADIKNFKTIDMVIKDGKVLDTRYHADFVNPLAEARRPFDISDPVPSVRAVFPMTAHQFHDVPLVIEGTNFVGDSVVELDGVAVATSPVKNTMLRETAFNPIYTRLTATIPGRVLNRIGDYKVVVKNPKPQGGTSNSVNFFVVQ